MLTNLREGALTPEQAASMARTMTKDLSGSELHKAFDRASNEILRSLGFGDFVDQFMSAVAGYHDGEAI